LAAIYIDTERVLSGGKLSAFEKATLETLSLSRPDSAPIQALSGKKDKAVELLEKQFGEDMPTSDGYDGWGSAPDAIMYVWTVSLLH
jgi:hypothetical protein